jgi:hypothetical protein
MVPEEDSRISSKHLKVQGLFLSPYSDQQKANRFVSLEGPSPPPANSEYRRTRANAITSAFLYLIPDFDGIKEGRGISLSDHESAGQHPIQKRGLPMRRLLGHTKIESTMRHLGIEVDDALAIGEPIDSDVPGQSRHALPDILDRSSPAADMERHERALWP